MVIRKLLERKLRSLQLKRERVIRMYDRRLKHINNELARLRKEHLAASHERAAEIRMKMSQLHVQEVFTQSYRSAESKEIELDIRKLEARLARPSMGERFTGWLKHRRKK